GRSLKVKRELGAHYALGEEQLVDLKTMDVVLMRQDPPFDMAYITATHVLEHIHPKTLVVNDPASVRNAPEKLFVTHFDNVMPPTLISADQRAIRAFREEHKDIILKPLFGNGGAGVFRVKADDENFNLLLEIIGPELARLGLLFVGIDVIGDYLTEINVTSPTGLQQINRFDDVSLEAQIWDRIEVRYQETRSPAGKRD